MIQFYKATVSVAVEDHGKKLTNAMVAKDLTAAFGMHIEQSEAKAVDIIDIEIDWTALRRIP